MLDESVMDKVFAACEPFQQIIRELAQTIVILLAEDTQPQQQVSPKPVDNPDLKLQIVQLQEEIKILRKGPTAGEMNDMKKLLAEKEAAFARELDKSKKDHFALIGRLEDDASSKLKRQ